MVDSGGAAAGGDQGKSRKVHPDLLCFLPLPENSHGREFPKDLKGILSPEATGWWRLSTERFRLCDVLVPGEAVL